VTPKADHVSSHEQHRLAATVPDATQAEELIHIQRFYKTPQQTL
jgi:hypothetical protein